jgi:hypothetical protein
MDAGSLSRFKRYLPSDDFKLSTQLAPDEVKARLEAAVAADSGSSRLFRGGSDGGVFRLERVIGYRNMFLPQAQVVVKPTAGGSSLSVKLRLKAWAQAFTAVWLISSFSTILLAFYLIFKSGSHLFLWVAPTLLFLFGYVMCMLGYKVEAANTKTTLLGLFKA